MATKPTLEEYALTLAWAARLRSEDPHRQVGACVLGRDGVVLGLGYNGPPTGVDLEPGMWANRQLVRDVVVHAETNALRFVRPREGKILATSYHPCLDCLRFAAAQGVHTIVYGTVPSTRWRPASVQLAARLFDIDLRRLDV